MHEVIVNFMAAELKMNFNFGDENLRIKQSLHIFCQYSVSNKNMYFYYLALMTISPIKTTSFAKDFFIKNGLC